jgi:hypothetical protein
MPCKLKHVHAELLENTPTWKMTIGGTNGLDLEELVFCVQGVLVQKDLPLISSQ